MEPSNPSSTPPPQPEQWQARAALLQIVTDARRAHLTTDVRLLLAHDADPLIVGRDGKVDTISHTESLRHFTESFRGATYHEWDYLEQPTIHIAGEASMAWMLSRVKVRRTKRQPDGSEEEQAFVYAGIDTYERRDGEWTRVANASTFAEE